MRSLLVIITATVLSAQFAAASPQKDAVLKFYELRERTLDQRGTANDVEKIISLLADGATYQHPMASVTMTKAQARSGMLAHLREGRNARYSLHPARFERDFAVVEYVLDYTVEGKKIRRPGVATFEFISDKISRVTEY